VGLSPSTGRKVQRNMTHRKFLRWPVMVGLLLLLVAVLSACTNPQTTFSPKSDTAQSIQTIYLLVIVMASIVMVGVFGVLGFALFRFRDRPGRVASQTHGNTKLEIIWTLLPIAILVIVGAPALIAVAGSAKAPDEDALHINVVGHQWWFEVQYPGMGPEDPNNPGERLPLITANEVHLPVGKQIYVTLESVDVIHSFWIPQLIGKTDMIPGTVNELQTFTPQEVGVFYGQCAEFCGTAHAQMRFRAVVESLGDFNEWAVALQTPPADPVSELAAAGQTLFLAKGCVACHTIYGMPGAAGKVGPDLTLLGDRRTIGAGIVDNTDEALQKWISNPQELKPGTLHMPSFGLLSNENPQHMSDAEIRAVSAFLRGMALE
jgi:cytochrome c oxidase subunit 2